VIKVGTLAKIRRLYYRDKQSIKEISHQTGLSRIGALAFGAALVEGTAALMGAGITAAVAGGIGSALAAVGAVVGIGMAIMTIYKAEKAQKDLRDAEKSYIGLLAAGLKKYGIHG
jgi:predicted phage tail protein